MRFWQNINKAQQIERDAHAFEAHTVCVGTFPNLGTPTLPWTPWTPLWVLPVFFVQVPVYATFDNSDNVGPLGCAGRRRALQLHAHSRCARARHCWRISGTWVRPAYEPPLAPAARSSHHCVCQCRCHASHTKLAQRHSAAPLLTDLETLSTPHLRTAPCTCRALLTPLRLPRHMCHLASHWQSDAWEACWA